MFSAATTTDVPGMYEKVELHDGAAWVVLDPSRYPIVITDWVGVPTTQLVDRYFEIYVALLQDIDRVGGRCVLITTADRAGRPPADVRKRIGDRTIEHRELISRLVVGNAVVSSNPLIRGAMTAISWMDPSMSVPFLSSLDEGFAYARRALADHGVDLPAIVTAVPT